MKGLQRVEVICAIMASVMSAMVSGMTLLVFLRV